MGEVWQLLFWYRMHLIRKFTVFARTVRLVRWDFWLENAYCKKEFVVVE